MTLQEYQLSAKRTCPSLGSDKLDLSHMVLGIFSEFEEYHNATDWVNKIEEVTDIMWYLANYCTFRGHDLSTIWNSKKPTIKRFTLNVSVLQDIVKKYIAYNKEINTITELEVLLNICWNLSSMYADTNIEQALQNNIDKLKVRYPDKFSEELAINRNLEMERKELEK